MKTLCSFCKFGLVIQEEENTEEKLPHSKQKCTFGNSDTYVESVISCNQYKRWGNKVTYYDPEFDAYESKILNGDKH